MAPVAAAGSHPRLTATFLCMADTLLIDIFVAGKPEPQGSTRAFVPTGKNGQPLRRPDGSIIVNLTSDNPALKAWRAQAAHTAETTWMGRPLEEGSLAVELDFYLRRPEGDWGTGRNAHLLKDSGRGAPTTIPDLDKLCRAALDAFTGVIYKDDSQVTALAAEKHYALPDGSEYQGQGVHVRVYRRATQTAAGLPAEQRVRVVPAATAAVDDAQLALA